LRLRLRARQFLPFASQDLIVCSKKRAVSWLAKRRIEWIAAVARYGT
jgi:hypothetical protein